MELTSIEIKNYCRIDGNLDDSLIDMLKSSAEEYLLGAGIPRKYDDFTYRLTVLSLILYYYEERNSSGAPESCTDAIIQLQLKYKGESNEGVWNETQNRYSTN